MQIFNILLQVLIECYSFNLLIQLTNWILGNNLHIKQNAYHNYVECEFQN